MVQCKNYSALHWQLACGYQNRRCIQGQGWNERSLRLLRLSKWPCLYETNKNILQYNALVHKRKHILFWFTDFSHFRTHLWPSQYNGLPVNIALSNLPIPCIHEVCFWSHNYPLWHMYLYCFKTYCIAWCHLLFFLSIVCICFLTHTWSTCVCNASSRLLSYMGHHYLHPFFRVTHICFLGHSGLLLCHTTISSCVIDSYTTVFCLSSSSF